MMFMVKEMGRERKKKGEEVTKMYTVNEDEKDKMKKGINHGRKEERKNYLMKKEERTEKEKGGKKKMEGREGGK